MTFVISAFQMYVLYFGHFFENRKNSGLTPGQYDDPVMTQFHVWYTRNNQDQWSELVQATNG